MNVWTTSPRCSQCRAKLALDDHREHKFSCSRWRGWSELTFLPRRDPGRSLRQPEHAHWPSNQRQVKRVKTTTWHVIPSHEIVHVTDQIAIFNDSDRDAHVEVASSGELLVKPLDYGRLSIAYLLAEDE